jgi:antitoxin (DNA-binding transcriptional repressor) of toxin-antitoxin stability system
MQIFSAQGGMNVRASLAELKTEPEKYIGLADKQDIYVTEDGKAIARITSAGPDKVEAARAVRHTAKRRRP